VSTNKTALALLVASTICCGIAPVNAQPPAVKTLEVGTASPAEVAWKRLTDPAEVLEEQVFEKLKINNVKWLIDNTEPRAISKLGIDGYRKVLAESIIPYFKDYSKPVCDLTICVAKCGANRGFSFYDYFYSTSGKKKPYMIEINLDEQGHYHIYGITMGTSFKDEYPNGNESIVLFRKQNANAFIGQE
jgi:hypothetical protein